MFPKTGVLPTMISILLPVNVFTARTDVIVATKRTNIKLAFALMECGRNKIKIIPATGINKAERNNKNSIIDIW